MFTYIDLFCGIGGFHQAMDILGGKCVFASEIDKDCIKTYNENYGIDCNINIREIDESKIPKFDMLCGGFPCQSFSKAGKQEGFNDKTKGTLFFEILRILKYHQPKYILLENVRNLVTHDKGFTWDTIQSELKNIGYITTKEPLILSPHQFGIPQLRERVIIVGIHRNFYEEDHLDISFDALLSKDDNSVYNILDEIVDDSYNITKEEEKILDMWDEFYKGIKENILGFPIWADYFKYDGDLSEYPKWKQNFINKNMLLYHNNKVFIDEWLEKYNNLSDINPTYKKLEWQCGDAIQTLWDGIIQFRPSGVRVKKPDCFPALVAMVHIPIVGKYKRRLTERETARLQSFPENFIICNNRQQAYKQFGNSVNVNVIKCVAEKLMNI